jgi:hypothetical protein
VCSSDLPRGAYRIVFWNPADGAPLNEFEIESNPLGPARLLESVPVLLGDGAWHAVELPDDAGKAWLAVESAFEICSAWVTWRELEAWVVGSAEWRARFETSRSICAQILGAECIAPETPALGSVALARGYAASRGLRLPTTSELRLSRARGVLPPIPDRGPNRGDLTSTPTATFGGAYEVLVCTTTDGDVFHVLEAGAENPLFTFDPGGLRVSAGFRLARTLRPPRDRRR